MKHSPPRVRLPVFETQRDSRSDLTPNTIFTGTRTDAFDTYSYQCTVHTKPRHASDSLITCDCRSASNGLAPRHGDSRSECPLSSQIDVQKYTSLLWLAVHTSECQKQPSYIVEKNDAINMFIFLMHWIGVLPLMYN